MGEVVAFRSNRARFHVGQLVHHRLFGYRGVIVDADPRFAGSDAWYERVARTRPPKDRPWYHVLVHRGEHATYVAERNLEPEPQPAPVEHPLLDAFFARFDGTGYLPRNRHN
ncbi:MAG TPA: heat shock protein HspQ [Gammaproteobacteria bacterium]